MFGKFSQLWLCVVLALLASAVFGANLVSNTELAAANSRYVFLPPIDDGGKSSGPHAVTICLPSGYSSTDRRYPVIYLLDGDSSLMTSQHGFRDTIAYEQVHDQLVHDGLIEPAIFVAVHNSTDADGNYIQGNRGTDYHYSTMIGENGAVLPSKSEGYYEYLAKTIKPMVDNAYRTRTDPASTGIAGFSAGGAGAFWMTYLHPETFGMGICQSPPFFSSWVNKELQAMMNDTKRPIPAVKLWFDAGSQEYDFIYKDAYAAYRTLIAQGFRSNENIAFYTGHGHGHEKFDCNRRLRAGLYFMLRTKTPTMTGVEITEMESESMAGGPINLARPGHLVLETIYDNWFRLTDCTAEFSIKNSKVASLTKITNEIRPITPGRTTVTSSYAGRKIVRDVQVVHPTAQQQCVATQTPIAIDGDLSDWPKLPVLVEKPLNASDVSLWSGPADLSYRFGCTYDDKYFYVAIQTTDEIIDSVPGKDPWFQDGVEVRLDARPEKERMFGQGKEFEDFLLVAMSPAKAGGSSIPHNVDKLPAGTKAVCVATPTGHNTEIAIPISYLNEKAGQPWHAVRLNVVVNDFDNDYKGFGGDKFWWQADWRTPGSTWGSGTFVKK